MTENQLVDPPQIYEPRKEPAYQLEQLSDSRALMTMIERAALTPDFDVGKLDRLLEIKERWDSNHARKSYTAAMARFKANPPEILKDKQVSYTTTKGRTEYAHATLGAVCRAVIKGLSEHGFSHRWDVKQFEDKVVVACIVTHEEGHSENVTLFAFPDESGSKNSIQALGSTITYLQRYSLLSVTGLAAAEDDDDGAASEVIELITDNQALDLQALAEEVGADKTKFLAFLNVEKLADLPKKRLQEAVQALKNKAKK